jgi:hypothetical protein
MDLILFALSIRINFLIRFVIAMIGFSFADGIVDLYYANKDD